MAFMKKLGISLFLYIIIFGTLSAQVYLEKQTRHRFAQLNMGVDYQRSFGGAYQYLNDNGNLLKDDLDPTSAVRFLIGGTHFWGHADFYVAIPMYESSISKNGMQLSYSSGVETIFKVYPWRIKSNRIRPFVGLSLTPFYYEQKSEDQNLLNGPELNHTSVPLYGGLTFNHKNHLLEVNMLWNYNNQQSYYISREVATKIETPPFYAAISYRYMLETTLGAERDWESGRTAEVTEILASRGKLNSFFAGIGMSSAFWLRKSSYNQENRPYIERFSTSIMPEISVGYYLNQPDVFAGLAYRGYSSGTNSYGTQQSVRRRSLVAEVTKYLFDYHGFVPYVGPAISYENLKFVEVFENETKYDLTQQKLAYGVTFGWDIRPNRLQSWILRTNLRWFPGLKLDLEDDLSISYDNIEFNFIQWIVYPGRMFGK